jgi:hypothetical protein
MPRISFAISLSTFCTILYSPPNQRHVNFGVQSFFFSFTFRNISLHPFSNILIFLLTFTVCSCRIQHLASIRELVDLILLNDFTSYICFALASAFRNTPVSLFICYDGREACFFFDLTSGSRTMLIELLRILHGVSNEDSV